VMLSGRRNGQKRGRAVSGECIGRGGKSWKFPSNFICEKEGEIFREKRIFYYDSQKKKKHWETTNRGEEWSNCPGNGGVERCFNLSGKLKQKNEHRHKGRGTPCDLLDGKKRKRMGISSLVGGFP